MLSRGDARPSRRVTDDNRARTLPDPHNPRQTSAKLAKRRYSSAETPPRGATTNDPSDQAPARRAEPVPADTDSQAESSSRPAAGASIVEPTYPLLNEERQRQRRGRAVALGERGMRCCSGPFARTRDHQNLALLQSQIFMETVGIEPTLYALRRCLRPCAQAKCCPDELA